MTIGQDVFSTLRTLVGNRVVPNTFPQPPAVPTWPAIRYTIISKVPFSDICGYGEEETAEPRIQLDLVALEYKQVEALELQVLAAMKLYPQPTLWENSSFGYDADTKTQRIIMEFTIHGSSSSGNSPP